MKITSKKILSKIGCDKLKLWYITGQSYWVFEYDDLEANGRYDDMAVYTPRLNDMTLDQWVETGKAFVKKIEGDGQ